MVGKNILVSNNQKRKVFEKIACCKKVFKIYAYNKTGIPIIKIRQQSTEGPSFKGQPVYWYSHPEQRGRPAVRSSPDVRTSVAACLVASSYSFCLDEAASLGS